MTLTAAITQVLNRILRRPDIACAVFVCDGELRLTDSNSRIYKNLMAIYPECLIGAYSSSVKVLDLVDDLSAYFQDEAGR